MNCLLFFVEVQESLGRFDSRISGQKANHMAEMAAVNWKQLQGI